MNDQQSQNQMLRAHFDMGLRITGLKASRQFGISHLPRRILDLKEAGYPLADEWVKVEKSNGKKTRVKEWRKAPEGVV